MHNITKIKLFRILLRITYIPSLILLYPLAFFRKKSGSGLFFFFDRYSLGGAQKVHLDILHSVEKTEKTVFFTRKSPDDTFKRDFEKIPNASIHYIDRFCDPVFIRLFSVHYFAFYLNRHANPRILGSNSTFFYDLLPFLKKEATTIELLHNFSYGSQGMEFFGLKNYSWLSHRLVIDEATRNNILEQYQTCHVPIRFSERVRTIEFGVEVPDSLPVKTRPPLNVFYAGRGGPQKRIQLINAIAIHFIQSGLPVRFHFAGTFESELSAEVKQHARLYGAVSDGSLLKRIFSEGHVLLMTSAYEGFPVLVKEAMAFGCVPVVTALPGMMTHLTDGENALLINSPQDETGVIAEGIRHIQSLFDNKERLEKMSRICFEYAKDHFDRKSFFQSYAELLRVK
jgi:glycosyltransferase involved in cell wall biosynthesis